MKLITNALHAKLVAAGSANNKPICKLFCPWNSCTWLITGIEDGILYGFADLGMGCVEFGPISSIADMEKIRHASGLGIERDRWWEPKNINYFELNSLSKE